MIDNKLLNDLAKFTNSAISTVSGTQRQMRRLATEQFEHIANAMDLVSRKELDVYKDIAQKALMKVDELEKRLDKLEAKKTSKKSAE